MAEHGVSVALGLVLTASLIASGYMVIYSRDMVYASGFLALLGLANAVFVALLGFPIVAAFIIIVYVGAAVMFLIISISMLGGGGGEEWSKAFGALTALAVIGPLALVLALGGINRLYMEPPGVELATVADSLITKYLPVIFVLLVALAATVIEAISIAKRG